MESQEIILARAAYSRYGAVTDYKNFLGQPMPTWDELPPKIREAWVAAANPATPTPPAARTPDEQAVFINNLLDAYPTTKGLVSDGYHSFNELYDHRITLWIALCKSEHCLHRNAITNTVVWRSQAHSDGSVWPGWFLLGIGKKQGNQITYHLPLSAWEQCGFAETLDQAPTFDGHTSAQVLERLKAL